MRTSPFCAENSAEGSKSAPVVISLEHSRFLARRKNVRVTDSLESAPLLISEERDRLAAVSAHLWRCGIADQEKKEEQPGRSAVDLEATEMRCQIVFEVAYVATPFAPPHTRESTVRENE